MPKPQSLATLLLSMLIAPTAYANPYHLFQRPAPSDHSAYHRPPVQVIQQVIIDTRQPPRPYWRGQHYANPPRCQQRDYGHRKPYYDKPPRGYYSSRPSTTVLNFRF